MGIQIMETTGVKGRLSHTTPDRQQVAQALLSGPLTRPWGMNLETGGRPAFPPSLFVQVKALACELRLHTYFSNWWSFLPESLIHSGTAAPLPAKDFVPFPTAPFVFVAPTTVARLVAAHARRKEHLTHPVGSFLVQGEAHGQPKSPTRRLNRGPLISSWASSSWTVDARAPAVARWRQRPRQRRP